jgi:hypothetical protein
MAPSPKAAQHGFLRGDEIECLVQHVRDLEGLAAQDKRQPARLFGVSMLVCTEL